MQCVTYFKKILRAWGKWEYFNLGCVLDDSNVPVLNLLISVIIAWIPLFLGGTC